MTMQLHVTDILPCSRTKLPVKFEDWFFKKYEYRMHEKRTMAADIPVAWCVCQSVSKYVCLSHASALQKRINVPSRLKTPGGSKDI